MPRRQNQRDLSAAAQEYLLALRVTAGAEDESEMGAFHDLFQPQRAANLRQRLAEYTPAGINAGIILAT